ncbi:MAG: hypothetical protein QOF84_7655 [Streptomyces sp.]|jgi:hypothetical protein|nr:hypothetical protein [Streptomyces sp.]
MTLSELRATCEQRLAQLELPHRFSTDELCDAVAALRGKPIVLRPLDTLGAIDAPCGIRIETDEADLVFYERGTSRLHQEHIKEHEIAHILCDHPGALSLGGDIADAVGLNPTLVMRMSGRTSYATADEREAELMATLIRQRAYYGQQFPTPRPMAADDRWDALFSGHSPSKERS